jgi:hypothetical protein
MLHRYLRFGSKSNNRLGFKKVSRMVSVFNEKVQLILQSGFRLFLTTVHVIFLFFIFLKKKKKIVLTAFLGIF